MRDLIGLTFRLPAIWKTKDYDIPVTVIKYLGQRDGLDWFLVESSEGEQTGVSAADLFVER